MIKYKNPCDLLGDHYGVTEREHIAVIDLNNPEKNVIMIGNDNGIFIHSLQWMDHASIDAGLKTYELNQNVYIVKHDSLVDMRNEILGYCRKDSMKCWNVGLIKDVLFELFLVEHESKFGTDFLIFDNHLIAESVFIYSKMTRLEYDPENIRDFHKCIGGEFQDIKLDDPLDEADHLINAAILTVRDIGVMCDIERRGIEAKMNETVLVMGTDENGEMKLTPE